MFQIHEFPQTGRNYLTKKRVTGEVCQHYMVNALHTIGYCKGIERLSTLAAS